MVPRVYIAAPFPMKPEAIQLRAMLQKNGIDVTSRWLDGVPKGVEAEWDLQDVLNAHAVVAINPEEYRNSGTGGRHVELGYAIAHSIPVFILGCRSHVFHDMCDLIDNETVLIAALHASPASFSYRHHVQSLRAMFARVHRANQKWWRHIDTGAPLERNFGELLMLVTSELAEAMEGHRKSLQDDKLPAYPMVTVELADALIRLFDMAGSGQYGDVAQAFDDKMHFNAVRADHQVEHRKSAHGKKY
jgi:hypothetical protein